MSSHVPFLAVRPDDQFSTDVKKTVGSAVKTSAPPPSQPMDSAPPLTPAPPRAFAATSRIPSAFRFPLLVVLSLGLSTLFRTWTSNYSGLALATASRSLQEPAQIGVLLGWKAVQLFIVWAAGYDYEEIAALVVLTNQPFYHLLHSHYSITLLPLFLNLLIDITVIALPFALLRPLTRANAPLTPKTPNQSLSTDYQILGLTAILAATVYAVTFFLSYHANLGVFLITHFDNMTTMSAHDSGIFELVQLFAVTGFAAMTFLFRPTIAAAGTPALRETTSHARTSSGRPGSAAGGSRRGSKKFNPETATLAETFAYNLGYGETGFTHRANVLAKRTAVVAGCVFVNTVMRGFGTVEGTDVGGAVGYAGLWAGANVLVAVAYGLLSDEE